MYDVRAATINIPRCSSDRQEPSWHRHERTAHKLRLRVRCCGLTSSKLS